MKKYDNAAATAGNPVGLVAFTFKESLHLQTKDIIIYSKLFIYKQPLWKLFIIEMVTAP